MADQPVYTTVPGKLPDLFAKIRQAGVPPKANGPWLKQLGFTSSNDPSLLPVLRQIGFVDQSSVPTPAWKQYRGGDHAAVLGRAIVTGYESLYAVYPDAHDRSNTELSNVFSTLTPAGKQTVDKMTSTFKNLVGLATFDSVADEGVTQPHVPQATASVAPVASVPLGRVATNTSGVLAVNVNIQLTLPETTDEKWLSCCFRGSLSVPES